MFYSRKKSIVFTRIAVIACILTITPPAHAQASKNQNATCTQKKSPEDTQQLLLQTTLGVITGAATGATCAYTQRHILGYSLLSYCITWCMFSACRNKIAQQLNAEINKNSKTLINDSMITETAWLADWATYTFCWLKL